MTASKQKIRQAPDPVAVEKAAESIRQFQAAMNAAFIARDEQIRILCVALVCSEHMLLLGPPGVAKSKLAQVLVNAMHGAFFEILMTRFTAPEELFGQISYTALQKDVHRRVTTGYLPEATVGFLDEVWKAGSPILNSLLTLVNERKFDNGGTRVNTPLEMVVGASNELPEENAGLEALFDRFIFRSWVPVLIEEDDFLALMDMDGEPAISATVDHGALTVLRDALDFVDYTPVRAMFAKLWRSLNKEHGIQPSDRRWRKAKKAVRAVALLEGRLYCEPEDLLILADSFWDNPDDRGTIHGAIASIVSPHLAAAQKLLDSAVEEYERNKDSEDTTVLGKSNAELKKILGDIKMLPQTPAIAKMMQRVHTLQQRVARSVADKLGLGEM